MRWMTNTVQQLRMEIIHKVTQTLLKTLRAKSVLHLFHLSSKEVLLHFCVVWLLSKSRVWKIIFCKASNQK